MRLASLWTAASIDPTASVAQARANTTGCQSSARTPSASTNTRISAANPAAFTAEAIRAVTGVGAPTYTSGAQAWNGTAATLNPRPTRSIARPASSIPSRSTRKASR